MGFSFFSVPSGSVFLSIDWALQLYHSFFYYNIYKKKDKKNRHISFLIQHHWTFDKRPSESSLANRQLFINNGQTFLMFLEGFVCSFSKFHFRKCSMKRKSSNTFSFLWKLCFCGNFVNCYYFLVKVGKL